MTTLEGGKQVIELGAVASQEIIKQLGTNGGGIFNANSAHPFENPSAISNFFSLLLIWSIPAAITHTFGKMVGSPRQGWAVLGAMTALGLAGILLCTSAEQTGTPHLAAAHIETAATALQSGGNMEGKEVRFGIANTALFATVTTDASCGAVDGWHDSFTPLGGLVPLANMQYRGPKVELIDASLAPSDLSGHAYFIFSYEMLTDIMWTLDGASVAERVAKSGLVCADWDGGTCALGAGSYILKVTPSRQPDFGRRLLGQVAPILLPLQ